MSNGQKVLDIAIKEIGYTEDPPNTNKNKFGKWFGFDSVPWCAMFVSWAYNKAGFSLGNIGFLKGFAGCQTAHMYFTKTKQLTDNPVAGDIVLYDWNDDKRYDHVGIFEAWRYHDENTIFTAIEGNTSFGNNSNGGAVMRRTRHAVKGVVFVHPKVLDQI